MAQRTSKPQTLPDLRLPASPLQTSLCRWLRGAVPSSPVVMLPYGQKTLGVHLSRRELIGEGPSTCTGGQSRGGVWHDIIQRKLRKRLRVCHTQAGPS